MLKGEPVPTKNDWQSLPIHEQRTLLKALTDQVLAGRFGQPAEFFGRARLFTNSVPQQIGKPVRKEHSPPKELVTSARRDLSFFEANFELFDNSIDRWRKAGAKSDLSIEVNYDLELRTGKYRDDAGGMEEGHVYKVFIPGETMNHNYSETVIGSFGMGAKKAIFRLSDGAKVVSGCNTKFSATSEVPERWEEVPEWETSDGRAAPIQTGTTEFYLFRLVGPPTSADIDELIRRTGQVYAPLLRGTTLRRKVNITINGVAVESGLEVNWSGAKGVQPRIYRLTHTFKNFLSTGRDITLTFDFQCGLTRKLPGQSEGAEPDWGVDVYGNGRLIEKYLKDEFAFGTKFMSKQTAGTKFFRGELMISGHSFAIPWDTHKREYLKDHPVSKWLREELKKVIKPYLTVARNFADRTDLRTTELQEKEFRGKPRAIAISPGKEPPKRNLAKWTFGATRLKRGKVQRKGSDQEESNGESRARMQEGDVK